MFFPYHDDNPTTRFPLITLGLIVLNAVTMLSVLALPAERRDQVVVERGFIPQRMAQFANPRLTVEVSLDQRVKLPFIRQVAVRRRTFQLPADHGQILLSLVTAMFLHGGWAHLIGNMWFLWIFGNNVEDRLGGGPFLAFYLGGGLLATACHWAYDPQSAVPVIGASGAVAAVLGAYAVTFPHARVRSLVFLFYFFTVVELPALVVLGVWFAGQLLDALGALTLGIDGGVAWWAHVGGFVSGALVMFLLPARRTPPASLRPRQLPWERSDSE